MEIDTNFNFYSDAKGIDPDNSSPTLKRYHKLLWSKPLPNGKLFELHDNESGAYLCHASELAEFYLGSDAITHSYKYQKRMVMADTAGPPGSGIAVQHRVNNWSVYSFSQQTD